MPDLKKILETVHIECTKNNCQSWNTICLISMQNAVDEQKQEFIDRFEGLITDPESTKEDFVKLLQTIELE